MVLKFHRRLVAHLGTYRKKKKAHSSNTQKSQGNQLEDRAKTVFSTSMRKVASEIRLNLTSVMTREGLNLSFHKLQKVFKKKN